MSPTIVRSWAYSIAAMLGLAYCLYVIVLKWQASVTGGPLGDVGEFLLVLVAVTAFAVGLLADESSRNLRPKDDPASGRRSE
jgi:hypothetical protein